jgi:hypothetical protein
MLQRYFAKSPSLNRTALIEESNATRDAGIIVDRYIRIAARPPITCCYDVVGDNEHIALAEAVGIVGQNDDHRGATALRECAWASVY